MLSVPVPTRRAALVGHLRIVAAVTALTICAATAHADEVAARRSRGMMIAGIVLTVAGIVLLAPGIAFVADAAHCHSVGSYSCGEQGAGVEALGGGAMIGLGGSLVVTGVPLWIVGQVRLKRARLSAAPTSLALRF